MRSTPLIAGLMLVLAATRAPASSGGRLDLIAGGGLFPNGHGGGMQAAAGPAFFPTLSLLGEFRYGHHPHRSGTFSRTGTFEEAGGDIYCALLTVRVTPLGSRRISPFGIAGAGIAWYHRQAEGSFEAANDRGRALTFGGGATLRLTPRVRLSCGLRLVAIDIGVDGMFETPIDFEVILRP